MTTAELWRWHLFASLMAVMATVFISAAEPAAQQPHAARPGVCLREGTKLVGAKPVTLKKEQRPPKKVQDARPRYPELPPGTRASGMWTGELLIGADGRVRHIWPIREVQLTPPLPEFNQAIVDALRQWKYEPLIQRSRATPFCTAVTVEINWQ